MPRPIQYRYRDPVDEIWIATAERLGVHVRRADDAYAAYDGLGVLTVATDAHLDPDDCLAQIILHELCHALVAGPNALAKRDWGLSSEDGRDLVREHACHRVQAALADRHGLRGFFAVTTDHRPYWDALGQAPLVGEDDATVLAREAYERACHGPWAKALTDALEATAVIARTVRAYADDDSLWRA